MKSATCISILGLTVMLVSCSQKLYQPAQAHSDWVTNNVSPASLADLEFGRTLYIAACQTCHYLHYPSEFTRSEWDHVFPEMSVNANLSDSNKIIIYNYIIAGAADTGL